MPTTNTTQSSINYQPQSLQQYNSFWSMASPILNSLIQNPYANSNYNLNLAQATQAAQKSGTMATQNALSNMTASGMNMNSGVGASLMSQGSRYTSNLNYQGFLAAANQAQSNQWNAMGVQAGKQPLSLGGTTNQTTSGLGSWLPQVASLALGAATGGMSLAAQGAAGATNSLMGSSALASTPSSAFNAPLGSAGMLQPGQGTSTSSAASSSSPFSSNFNPFSIAPAPTGTGPGQGI
jgi:hypothetical protein